MATNNGEIIRSGMSGHIRIGGTGGTRIEVGKWEIHILFHNVNVSTSGCGGVAVYKRVSTSGKARIRGPLDPTQTAYASLKPGTPVVVTFMEEGSRSFTGKFLLDDYIEVGGNADAMDGLGDVVRWEAALTLSGAYSVSADVGVPLLENLV